MTDTHYYSLALWGTQIAGDPGNMIHLKDWYISYMRHDSLEDAEKMVATLKTSLSQPAAFPPTRPLLAWVSTNLPVPGS